MYSQGGCPVCGRLRSAIASISASQCAADLPKRGVALDPKPQSALEPIVCLGLARRALPYAKHSPAQRIERFNHEAISLHVGNQLGPPEVWPCRWQLRVSAILVHMPKTAMDKDGHHPPRHNDVGRPRQVAPMQAESISRSEQQPPYQLFGSGILALDASHHPAAILGRHDIDHSPLLGSRWLS